MDGLEIMTEQQAWNKFFNSLKFELELKRAFDMHFQNPNRTREYTQKEMEEKLKAEFRRDGIESIKEFFRVPGGKVAFDYKLVNDGRGGRY